MIHTTLSIALASLAITITTASADTVIEFKNNNTQSQFLTNGTKARINTRDKDDYMLVNFDKNAIYSVTPETRQITNFSDSLPSISGIKPPAVRLKLTPQGNGPVIAGFRTHKYRFSANGEHCGSLYASIDALKGTDIENMFETMKSMADSHLQSLGAFAALIPVCQMAQMEFADILPEIGAPMRIVNKEGRIDTEITKILKNAAVEAHNYSFPADYELVSTEEKIEQAQRENTQTGGSQRNSPEMRRTMQQMQYTGRYRRMPGSR
jgi:hypothetical protein